MRRWGDGEMGRWGEKDYFVPAPLPFQEYTLNHVFADINAVEGVKRYPNGSCRAEHEVSR